MFQFVDEAGNMAGAAERIAIEATDDEIDAIIEECGGDPREAIRALLHDLAALAIDAEASISRGYVRGRLLLFRVKDEHQ